MSTIQLFLLPCLNTRARRFRRHPCFGFGYGTDGVRVRPPVSVVMRDHPPLVEVHFATAVRVAARDGRPIVAPVAHEIQRTGVPVAKARRGEPHGGIRTADFVVEVPTVVPGTFFIEL